MALSSSPGRPASSQAREGQGSSNRDRSLDTGQPKRRTCWPTKRSSVAGELGHVLLSFLPAHNLTPSCFLHPMSGDGFGIKNEPQYHNYSRIPTNRSSLMNNLFSRIM